MVHFRDSKWSRAECPQYTSKLKHVKAHPHLLDVLTMLVVVGWCWTLLDYVGRLVMLYVVGWIILDDVGHFVGRRWTLFYGVARCLMMLHVVGWFLTFCRMMLDVVWWCCTSSMMLYRTSSENPWIPLAETHHVSMWHFVTLHGGHYFLNDGWWWWCCMCVW
jgi:hypothetical protein